MEETNNYTARFASTNDIRNCVEWIHANREKNHYDPEIFQYDSTRVVAVDKDGSPMMYLPYQLTIMTDALAPKPARTFPEIARGLKEAINFVVRLAKKSKIGEVYFLADPEDKATIDFACAHGYERLNLVPMRLKPSRMTPPLTEDVKEQA
jgi:hypothetical protein